jgi:DNA-binding transcriptional ArsR family regulator
VQSPRASDDLGRLDRLVHEPARLAILTALSAVKGADFTFLLRLTGLTKGNLSSHLQKLEDGSLVEIEKRFVGKVPNTRVSLTAQGRATIQQHWKRLDAMRRWRP